VLEALRGNSGDRSIECDGYVSEHSITEAPSTEGTPTTETTPSMEASVRTDRHVHGADRDDR